MDGRVKRGHKGGGGDGKTKIDLGPTTNRYRSKGLAAGSDRATHGRDKGFANQEKPSASKRIGESAQDDDDRRSDD